MDTGNSLLNSIEHSVGAPQSQLADALRSLSERTLGRGTCLLLEHEDLGETMIADPSWPLDLAQTKDRSEQLALADVRSSRGFLRIAVLAAPLATGMTAPAHAAEMAMNALMAIEAVADIATQFAANMLPMDTGSS